MLSSTFTRFAAVELPTPGKGGATSKPDVVLSVRETGILLNGVPVDVATMGLTLAARFASGERNAVLLVGANARSQEFASALQATKSAGFSVSISR